MLFKVKINGSQQWLFNQGDEKKQAPVLLFVHGGPGSPLMPFSRAFDSDLLKNFVVVHWDQRGAGLSHSRSQDPTLAANLNLDLMIEDGIQVSREICEHLGREQVILVGHSWGSVLATQMILKRPDLFYALVSVGTFVDWCEADILKFNFLQSQAKVSQDLDFIKGVEALGAAPYTSPDQAMAVSKLLMTQGALFHNLSPSELDAAIGLTQEYGEKDLELMEEGMFLSYCALGKSLHTYKGIEHLKKVNRPMLFAHGRHDLATPLELLEKGLSDLGEHFIAQKVEIQIFENSAHFPMWEEPAAFAKALESFVSNL